MFTQSEITLLKNVLLNSVKNGNTVNPVAFVPTSDEYQLLTSILQKINEN